MYITHPNEKLYELFKQKPYQGVAPENALFLFIGLDANYAENTSSQGVFPKIIEYHHNGVSFWKKYNVHHPFLLPEYKGDGRLYHRSFAKTGFLPSHAPMISFIELLHVPTVGRSRLVPSDLDKQHLTYIDSAIMDGHSRHIFVSSAVAKLMKLSGAFPWLKSKPEVINDGLSVYHRH